METAGKSGHAQTVNNQSAKGPRQVTTDVPFREGLSGSSLLCSPSAQGWLGARAVSQEIETRPGIIYFRFIKTPGGAHAKLRMLTP